MQVRLSNCESPLDFENVSISVVWLSNYNWPSCLYMLTKNFKMGMKHFTIALHGDIKLKYWKQTGVYLQPVRRFSEMSFDIPQEKKWFL